MSKRTKTEIIVVLDRSGSMYSVCDDTIGGFNSFVESQRKSPGTARLTLAEFDFEYELIHNGVNIKKVPPLTRDSYVPNGTTALLDAIGKTIIETESRLSSLSDKSAPDKVIFVIITDGEENSSMEFKLEKINSMINEKRDSGWDFVFLGANQDAIKTSSSLGVSAGYSMTYNNTKNGMNSVFTALSSATSNYRSSTVSYDNFFTDDDRARNESKKKSGGDK